MSDVKKALSFSPVMELFKPEKPKAKKKEAPPVTMQDKNVRAPGLVYWLAITAMKKRR